MDNKIVIPLVLGGKENLFIADKEFYTTDVGPKLEFNVTGISDFTNMTYSLTLTMADGSIYQHTLPVTGNPITYDIPDNEILHVGAVVGQVILNQAGEKVTFQEFVYKINLDLFSQATLDSLVSEVIVEDFDMLQTQVAGIHASVMANWDTIQATLNTMQGTYASNWSAWFTTNTNSITAEWVALKGQVNADKTAFNLAETTRASAESARVAVEAQRVTAENIRKADEVARGNSESSRVTQENARIASEALRVSKEAIRNTNDSNYTSNEQDRINEENIRREKEGERELNEAQREALHQLLTEKFASGQFFDQNRAIALAIVLG